METNTTTTQLIADIWESAVELDFPVSSFIRDNGEKVGLISDKSAYLHAIRTFPTEDLRRLLAALHHLKEPETELETVGVNAAITSADFEKLLSDACFRFGQTLQRTAQLLIDAAEASQKRECAVAGCKGSASHFSTTQHTVTLCHEHHREAILYEKLQR